MSTLKWARPAIIVVSIAEIIGGILLLIPQIQNFIRVEGFNTQEPACAGEL